MCIMTPREQLRKMTALGEQGALDEKHWYRLVNGMSAGGERKTEETKLHGYKRCDKSQNLINSVK